jgi:diacylglycerol kinase (ATP)
MQGFAAAWKNEAAFRQELVLAVLILPPGLWFASTGLERALLVASVIFVLVVELLNSAVEAAIDRISTEHHELSKCAKDLASAAVLLALLNVWVVWGFVFWPRLF